MIKMTDRKQEHKELNEKKVEELERKIKLRDRQIAYMRGCADCGHCEHECRLKDMELSENREISDLEQQVEKLEEELRALKPRPIIYTADKLRYEARIAELEASNKGHIQAWEDEQRMRIEAEDKLKAKEKVYLLFVERYKKMEQELKDARAYIKKLKKMKR